MKTLQLCALLCVGISLHAAPTTTSKNPVRDFSHLIKGGKNALHVFNKLTDGKKGSFEVLKLKGSAQPLPIVIKCYMLDCAPCEATAGSFQKIADDYAGKAHFVTIDVVKFEEIRQKLSIRGVPLFLIVLPNKKIEELGGAGKIERIRTKLNEYYDAK